ncbi:MAG: FAD-dependent 5-carboxymethylaminomethyl-2-thiouridine(34) oxidoreductase MnmC [Porticoccaceae bacterium]|nr:FAD-dependent 5-carboxymethylaminomethyl-2-thiouridine(34) oxidoreductase MnmC [Porticoccaceae bacterium]
MSKQKPSATPWYETANPVPRTRKTVTIIGAGISGCSVAAALQKRGFKVTVIDRHGQAGAEASGNPEGIVYPKLSPRDDLLPQVNLAAIKFASDYYRPFWDSGLGRQCGVLVVPENDKARSDFKLISQRYADQTEMVETIAHEQLEELSGVPLQAESALYFPKLGWLPPQLICKQLLELNNIPLVQADIKSLEYCEQQKRWQLYDKNQQLVSLEGDNHSESVIIASAFDCKAFSQTDYLPLRKIRGQITQLPCTEESRKMKMVICGECYITPAENGLHGCGATYNKDLFTTELRDIDHQTNLAQITATDAGLAAVLGQPTSDSLSGRANFRCTTSDYLPIAGPVPNRSAMLEDYAILRRDAKTALTTPGAYLPNLYVNCGMGSRGLSYAPLTAELLASEIAGEGAELDKKINKELRHAMHPARFLIRDLKRNRI